MACYTEPTVTEDYDIIEDDNFPNPFEQESVVVPEIPPFLSNEQFQYLQLHHPSLAHSDYLDLDKNIYL